MELQKAVSAALSDLVELERAHNTTLLTVAAMTITDYDENLGEAIEEMGYSSDEADEAVSRFHGWLLNHNRDRRVMEEAMVDAAFVVYDMLANEFLREEGLIR